MQKEQKKRGFTEKTRFLSGKNLGSDVVHPLRSRYELLPSCSTMLPFTQEPTELLKTSTALPGLKLGPSEKRKKHLNHV